MRNSIPFPLAKKIIIFLGLIAGLEIMTERVSPQEAPIKLFPNNCYRPKAEERHECFVLLSEQNLKRVEAKQRETPKKKPLSDFMQKVRDNRLANEERRQREEALNRQLVEASRTRNVSNKGKKYKITFGRVPEPTK